MMEIISLTSWRLKRSSKAPSWTRPPRGQVLAGPRRSIMSQYFGITVHWGLPRRLTCSGFVGAVTQVFARCIFECHISTSDVISLAVNVVDICVPLLLGLDVLDSHGTYINTVKNKLVCVNAGVDRPVVRNLGHVHTEWGPAILYTFPELQKIHKQHFLAIPEHLFPLIIRGCLHDEASKVGENGLGDTQAAPRRHRRLRYLSMPGKGATPISRGTPS